jgi:hypothetical protein
VNLKHCPITLQVTVIWIELFRPLRLREIIYLWHLKLICYLVTYLHYFKLQICFARSLFSDIWVLKKIDTDCIGTLIVNICCYSQQTVSSITA